MINLAAGVKRLEAEIRATQPEFPRGLVIDGDSVILCYAFREGELRNEIVNVPASLAIADEFVEGYPPAPPLDKRDLSAEDIDNIICSKAAAVARYRHQTYAQMIWRYITGTQLKAPENEHWCRQCWELGLDLGPCIHGVPFGMLLKNNELP